LRPAGAIPGAERSSRPQVVGPIGLQRRGEIGQLLLDEFLGLLIQHRDAGQPGLEPEVVTLHARAAAALVIGLSLQRGEGPVDARPVDDRLTLVESVFLRQRALELAFEKKRHAGHGPAILLDQIDELERLRAMKGGDQQVALPALAGFDRPGRPMGEVQQSGEDGPLRGLGERDLDGGVAGGFLLAGEPDGTSAEAELFRAGCRPDELFVARQGDDARRQIDHHLIDRGAAADGLVDVALQEPAGLSIGEGLRVFGALDGADDGAGEFVACELAGDDVVAEQHPRGLFRRRGQRQENKADGKLHGGHASDLAWARGPSIHMIGLPGRPGEGSGAN